MSQISAKEVKDLRDITGVGMMDCKRALEETGGDKQKAIEYLRRKGAALAAKRSEREAREGVIAIKLADDCRSGVIMELNCETDFVARGAVFTAFAEALASAALRNGSITPEQLLEVVLGSEYGGEKVVDAIKTMTGRLGEKLELKRLVLCQAVDGLVASYVHPGAQLGALVRLISDRPEDARGIARDLAMQVAAASPIVVDRAEVPVEWIDREREIYRQQALQEGRPEQLVEKIVSGRLEKYYQEVVLVEQPFIKDGNLRVSAVLDEFRKRDQATVEIKGFVRYQLGE